MAPKIDKLNRRPLSRFNKNTVLKKNKPDSESDGDSIFDEESEYETLSETDSTYTPPKKDKKPRRIITSEDEESEAESEFDKQEFRKTLAKIFPSKYMSKKIKDDEPEKKSTKSKKSKKQVVEEDSESEEEPVKKSTKSKKHSKKQVVEESDEESEEEPVKKSTKSKKHSKKQVVEESDEESDDDYDDEEDDDDDEEDDDDDETENKKGKNLNIVFTIGGNGDYDDDDYNEEYEDDSDEEDDDDADDDECNSDDEKTFMKERYEKVVMPKEDSESDHSKKSKKTRGGKKFSNKMAIPEVKPEINIETEYVELQELRKHLIEKLHKKPDSKILKNAIEECKDAIRELIQTARKKNTKSYYKLIHGERKKPSELDYFKKQLSNSEQQVIVQQMKEINEHINIEKPYRLALLQSQIPPSFKAIAMQKLNMLKNMEPGESEYYKIKSWVDTFMKIPFGIHKSLSITMDDGIEKCHDFMTQAKHTLDTCVYGLDDAKLQIMQMVGQWIANPGAMGTAIAIHGPMGTGKCHGIDTPILMYDGSIKMVQDIQVGDIVMGDDSTQRRVLSLGQGEDDMYDIITTKGDTYSVNSEHILCLKSSGINEIKSLKNKTGEIASYKAGYFNKNSYSYEYKNFKTHEEAEKYLNSRDKNDMVEITVKDYLNLPEYIQSRLKGYMTGVEFEEKSVLYDPYIIGVWLGDGCSSKSMISNQESVILSYLRTELKKDNLNLNHVKDYDYQISYDGYNRVHPGISKKTGLPYENKNVFMQVLQFYNLLNNKHIPDDYKINSRNIRLQMLAGLLDTDGWFDKKNRNYEITQKSKQLSDDIVYLCRSLGFCATQNECEKYCMYKGEKQYGTYYRVLIYGEGLEEIPTKCPRKQAEYKLRQKNALVAGIKVVPKGRGTYYGFELDNNHRYVLGNFHVTHNTSLIRDGISKILGREFAFIALGGAGDSSFLEGHSYTYEGSTWGKIVQILIQSKCMNPVIYFDELDKISETPRGEEIVGILTHLTDTSQNSQFHDKYFSEVDFDLSKCLFIFSYNDESRVNPILKDRMYRIQTKGYEAKDKIVIAKNYILPKIREQVKFAEGDVIIPEDTIQYIASNEALTNGEAGVRNLKRCLEIIHTKLNLFRLMKPGDNIFSKDMDLKVEFPMTVTRKVVDALIKNEHKQNQSMLAMYC